MSKKDVGNALHDDAMGATMRIEPGEIRPCAATLPQGAIRKNTPLLVGGAAVSLTQTASAEASISPTAAAMNQRLQESALRNA